MRTRKPPVIGFCPSCGARIRAHDVIPDVPIAACSQCGHTIDVPAPPDVELVPVARLPIASLPPQRSAGHRLPTPRPKNVRVKLLDQDVPVRGLGPYRALPATAAQAIEIIVRRRSPEIAIMVCVFVAWTAFALSFVVLALLSSAPAKLVVGILFALPGLCGTYCYLARLCNTIRIVVTSDRILVRHGPLPWPGKRTLPTAMVRQLYCQMLVSSGKNKTCEYNLLAALTDGRETALLTDLPSADQAWFIEEQVEGALGIAPEPVVGEHPPPSWGHPT